MRGGRRNRRRAAREISRQGRCSTTTNCAPRCAPPSSQASSRRCSAARARKNIGIGPLLDAIDDAAARRPTSGRRVQGSAAANGEPVERAPDPGGAVFGASSSRPSSIRSPASCRSFAWSRDAPQQRRRRCSIRRAASQERFGQLLRLEGKKQSPICRPRSPGEIVAVAKLKDTTTGDTLCDEKSAVIFPGARAAGAGHLLCDSAQDQGRRGKGLAGAAAPGRRGSAPSRPIAIRRPTRSSCRAPARCISRSRSRSSSANLTSKSNLQAPKVPYKETIKGRAEAQGKYKRQSGGRGQYGDCWLKIEPLARGKRLRVRRRDRRRRDPAPVHSVGRKGRAQYAARGVSRRLSDGRRQGHGLRRQLSRRRFLGHGVSRLRPRWASRRRSKRPGQSCSSRSWRST